jgi:hypothetical protein
MNLKKQIIPVLRALIIPARLALKSLKTSSGVRGLYAALSMLVILIGIIDKRVEV